MEIKKLTDLPIGELGEENYYVADVDGAVKRVPVSVPTPSLDDFVVHGTAQDDHSAGTPTVSVEESYADIVAAVKAGRKCYMVLTDPDIDDFITVLPFTRTLNNQDDLYALFSDAYIDPSASKVPYIYTVFVPAYGDASAVVKRLEEYASV